MSAARNQIPIGPETPTEGASRSFAAADRAQNFDSKALLDSPYLSRQRHIREGSNRLFSAYDDDGASLFNPTDPDIWTPSRVKSWLDANSFGLDWQQSLMEHKIEHSDFLALTSYVKVRRLVPRNMSGTEGGARLCNAIRKMLERYEQTSSIISPVCEKRFVAAQDDSLQTSNESNFSRTPRMKRLNEQSEAAASGLDNSLRDFQQVDPDSFCSKVNDVHELDSSSSALESSLPAALQPKLSDLQKRLKIIQVTKDNNAYYPVNITNAVADVGQCKQRIANKFGFEVGSIYITQFGGAYHESPLDDPSFHLACSLTDSRGSIAFFIELTASPVSARTVEVHGTENQQPTTNIRLLGNVDACEEPIESLHAEANTTFIDLSLSIIDDPGHSSIPPIVEDHSGKTQRGLQIQPETNPAHDFKYLGSTNTSPQSFEVISGARGDPLHKPSFYRKIEERSSDQRRDSQGTEKEDAFRILRPAKEIDFDAPRPSPYIDSVRNIRQDDRLPPVLTRTESGFTLIPHRPAPKRPPTSTKTDENPSEHERAPAMMRYNSNGVLVSEPLSKTTNTELDAATFNLDRSSRIKTNLSNSPASSSSKAHRRSVKGAHKIFDRDKALPMSFENAPSLEDDDEEPDEESGFWALRPSQQGTPTELPYKKIPLADLTTSFHPDSQIKHQSMKIRGSKPQASLKDDRLILQANHKPIVRASSPEYHEGDDTATLNSLGNDILRSPGVALQPANASVPLGMEISKRLPEEADPPGFSRNGPGRTWSMRPSADSVYENLQSFFPDHDLDKPMIVDAEALPRVHQSSDFQTSPGPQRRMKSIRIVAKEASEARKKFKSISYGIRAANLLRRRSTKVWGQKAVEVLSTQSKLSCEESDPHEDLRRIPTFKWLRGELIGKGQFGHVYLAMNVQTGEMLAVKQVDTPRRTSEAREKQMSSVLEILNAEIETMKDLDHVNIVQYLGYERTPTNISIFLEYVPGGSIGSCLRRYGKFADAVIRSLTRQTLEGLQYLHHRGILHRDLKADNLLLDLDGICKISDFGISKRSRDVYANDGTMSMQGTIFWMAPEVIQTKKQGYSAKIDIWSLGCVVLEMFAGRRPWSNEEAISVLYTLGQGQPPPIPEDVIPDLSDESRDFLGRCFTIDPSRRPTAAELLQHSFCQVPVDFTFNMKLD